MFEENSLQFSPQDNFHGIFGHLDLQAQVRVRKQGKHWVSEDSVLKISENSLYKSKEAITKAN